MDQCEVGGTLVLSGNDERGDLGDAAVAAGSPACLPTGARVDVFVDGASLECGAERRLTVR